MCKFFNRELDLIIHNFVYTVVQIIFKEGENPKEIGIKGNSESPDITRFSSKSLAEQAFRGLELNGSIVIFKYIQLSFYFALSTISWVSFRAIFAETLPKWERFFLFFRRKKPIRVQNFVKGENYCRMIYGFFESLYPVRRAVASFRQEKKISQNFQLLSLKFPLRIHFKNNSLKDSIKAPF